MDYFACTGLDNIDVAFGGTRDNVAAIDGEDRRSCRLLDIGIRIYWLCWEAVFQRRRLRGVDQVRMIFEQRADEQEWILRV